jgi:hypothetical protein
MVGSILDYGKRIFRTALIFNALMCVISGSGLLSSYYGFQAPWKPYFPYLISGSLFWVVIFASVMNIFAAVGVCREVKTGRLWFHHYVYGFAVLLISLFLAIGVLSVSFVSFLISYVTDVTVNVLRFFFFGGLALVLDDFPDISVRLGLFLKNAKMKTYRVRKPVHVLQFVLGLATLYVFSSICVWLAWNPEGAYLSNFIVAGSVLVTSLTCFGSIRWNLWRNGKC